MSEAVDFSTMTSKQLLGYFQEKAYSDSYHAHENGQLIGWSSSIAPAEFCEVMDVVLLYPENHAAAIAAKKYAETIINTSEGKGYDVDLCAYARINLGYMELLKQEAITGETPEALANCPAPRMPLPDLVITCNNICNTLLKWYENLAVELNIPYIIVDVPYNHTMPVSEHAREYIVDQFQYCIKQLEDACGKPFDYDKFVKVQEQTQRSVAAWDRAMAMCAHVPSPMNGFDMFNYMGLIVCARSKHDTEVTFNKLYEELSEHVANGTSTFKGVEKFRTAWEGIAVWPYLGATSKPLKALNCNVVGSTYPGAWSIHYDVGDLKAMAAGYSKMYSNTCLENKVDVISTVLETTHCTGITYHLNRSCKLMDFLNAETAELVKERTGVPYVSFDGDQADPRAFSPAQYETRVQALAEIMEQNMQEAAN